jgi:hypothetical protein
MNETRIVEINGVKMEVDLRHAKTVESYKSGDPVKVLVKQYSDTYTTKYGRIIDFNEFQSLPTIVIAYIDVDYSQASVKLVNFNANTKDIQIAPMQELEIGLDYYEVTSTLNRQIEKAESELKKQKDNKEYVTRCFEKYFK